jgi:hypothetical protein
VGSFGQAGVTKPVETFLCIHVLWSAFYLFPQLFSKSVSPFHRIGTEHEKFGFELETLHPIKYDQIRDILNGLSERFDWDKIMEESNVIGLKQVLCCIGFFY